MNPVTALKAILDAYGADSVARLDRTIYKYTDCGPHLSVRTFAGWKHSGQLGPESVAALHQVEALLIGSIVEGSDAEVNGTVIELASFRTKAQAVAAFDAQLEYVNAEACALWHEANEADCGVQS